MRSAASTGIAAANIGLPSRPGNIATGGIAPSPSLDRVLAAVGADHARHRARRGQIDIADRRVADRRAHEHAVSLARHGQVVGELAAAGQQRLVFAAQRAVIAAEAGRDAVHGSGPWEGCRAADCNVERHAAKSQVGLTPARGTDEIADQGDRISIMAEGSAGNKHPRCRATSGTGRVPQQEHNNAHGRVHAHARKIRARRVGCCRRRDDRWLHDIGAGAGQGADPDRLPAADHRPARLARRRDGERLPPVLGAGRHDRRRAQDRDRHRRHHLQSGSGADPGAPPRAAGEGALHGRAAVRPRRSRRSRR